MQVNVTLCWTTQLLRIFKEKKAKKQPESGILIFLNLKNRYDDFIGVYRFWLDIYLGTLLHADAYIEFIST